MEKKKVSKGWLVVGLAMAAVLIFAVVYVASNNKFEIVHSEATQIAGYEPSPEGVRLYASPSVKWSEISPVVKVLGWVFLGLMVCGFWYRGTNRHLKGVDNNSHDGKGTIKGVVAWLLPLILCIVTWFAGYSSSLDKGSLVMKFEEFKNTFQISDEVANQIRSEGGHGTNIKDENGLLTEWFKRQ